MKIIYKIFIFLIMGISNLSAEEPAALQTEQPSPSAALQENTNETGWDNFVSGFVNGYKAIEDGVITGYKAIEDGVVNAYKAIENWFVKVFKISTPQQGSKAENSSGKNTINNN